jgi:transcriptional regulator with XRE-family HTH domain
LLQLNEEDGAAMVGGRARVRSPRELTEDPETWPHQVAAEPGVEAVRQIAARLTDLLAERGWSLRQAAAASGVNRQAIANLIAGSSWPDVATVARLTAALGASLWPQTAGVERIVGHDASNPPGSRAEATGHDELAAPPLRGEALALRSKARKPLAGS